MPSARAVWGSFRRNWQAGLFGLCVFGVIIGVSCVFYVRGKAIVTEQLKTRLRETAAAAALQFDPAVLREIRDETDVDSPELQDTVHRLQMVRAVSPHIRYAYLVRQTDDPSHVRFIADADTLKSSTELDVNGNGKVEAGEEASYPGDLYDISAMPAFREGFIYPTVDSEVTIDQWGAWISGYAPVKARDGTTVAVLGIDMDAGEFATLGQSIMSPILFLLLAVIGLLLAGYIFRYFWQKRMEMLQKIDEEQSAVLLIALHQIGEAIAVFQWSLESFRDTRGKKKAGLDAEGFLRNMDVGVDRLKRILSDLYRAAEMDTGTFGYTPEWTTLQDVINDAIRECDDLLKKRDQQVALDIDANLKLPLDRVLICDVLQELLQNACSFSSPKSTISISAHRKGKQAIVEVRDQGPGIPTHDLPRLFQKFARAANAHLWQPDGIGLGLFIARCIVERAGGKIWLESSEGKGTRAFFTLPLSGE